MSRARAAFKVSISGSFDVNWVEYLGDMLVYADVVEGRVRTTTLRGQPPDLAAFVGILNLLVDFGFPVIECEYHRSDVSQETAACTESDEGISRG
jgi:hypothetical protein